MRVTVWRNARRSVAAVVIGLCAGCGTSPPGAGFTNGEPVIVGGPEKSAERTDLASPTAPAEGQPIAESAPSSTGGVGANGGSGGRGGEAGGKPTGKAGDSPVGSANGPR
jgi:hypothetical protein